MKYLLINLIFLTNMFSAFGQLVEPKQIPAFNNRTLNELGFKGYELLLNFDLGHEERIYKWQIEDPKNVDKSYVDQVQDYLQALYVDGTKVSRLFQDDLEDIKTAVDRLYYERRELPEHNRSWAQTGLDKFAAHLFVKTSEATDMELIQLEGIYGSFATMSGVGVIDKKTNQVLIILTGFSE